MLTTITVAGLEVEPWEEVECQGSIGCCMILLVSILLVMVVGYDVTVVWKTVEVAQTEAIFSALIINRYERRHHISLFQLILWLMALGKLEVYIGIEVDDSLGSMYLHTCDVMALAVTEEDTLLVSVVVRYRVLTLFCTTAQTYHVALSQTLTTDSIYPVRVYASLMSYVCWQRFTGILVHHLMHLLIAFSIQEVEVLRYLSKAEVRTEINLSLALLTVLGCDQNHTVGSYRTIDGSSSTILQNLHRLDVLRVHAVDIAWETVHNIKRFIATGCLDTTNLDAHTGTGVTTTSQDVYTGYLTLQSLSWVGSSALSHLLGIDRRKSTGHIATLHGTITYYNHFAQRLGVLAHGDVHVF